jgi:hypothetical protein
MIDLYSISSEYFAKNTTIGMNLEPLYKQHIGNSHHAALEQVFKAGIEYAILHIKTREDEIRAEATAELDNLRAQFQQQSERYNKLAAMIAAKNEERTAEPDMNQQAMKQALGMGNNFK